jgi:outer membrane lipopolysaccharide assembly protein LptE/RlpB
MKKKIFFFISIIFIYSCGYTPLYLEGKKDILVNIKEIKGDLELNNYIKNDLKISSNKDSKNIFDLNIETKYEKIILTKDATGKATDYKLNFTAKFTIVSKQNKIINYNESFKIKNSDEKFEQSNYEKEIKKNFSEIINDKLTLYLISLNDN